MDINILMLCVAIASVSCCVWTHFINDPEKIFLTDQLTNVFNRHFIPEIENKELSGSKYYVVFADIDFFKKVNDTYGHDNGDLTLIEFSRILKQSIKNNSDYIVRWGGEEFVIFLKVINTEIFTEDKLLERVNYLRNIIEKSNIEINAENIDSINITSSFGICSNLDLSIEDRIKEADKNLYKAKTTGRNKVVA